MPHKDDEQRRAYNRMRYAERMASDPEWAAKKKKQQAESYQRRKQKDPEFVQRRAEQFKRWYDFRGKEAAREREGYMSREEWLKFCEKKREERREQYRARGSRYARKVAYDAAYEEQKGCCAICGIFKEKTERHHRLVVDHCHDTGVFRGLLCHNCNVALGLLGDNINSLHNAIFYLRKWKGY